MQNKSKLNKILLIVVLILLVVGLVYIFFNKQKQQIIGNNSFQANKPSDVSVNSNGVKIISPKNGDEFKAGDIVNVNILVGINVPSINILSGTSVENAQSIQQKNIITTNGGNYTFTYNIPNTFVGPLEFDVISYNASSHDTATVQVVNNSATPVEFVIDESTNPNSYNNDNQIGLFKALNPEARSTVGFSIRYSDNSVKKIPFEEVKTTVRDSNIVEVKPYKSTNYASFYAKNIGTTNVTFTYKNMTKTMKVVVISL